MKRRITLAVSFDMPDHSTMSEAIAYVFNAVRSECGQLNPEMPMASLDRNTVEVKNIKVASR